MYSLRMVKFNIIIELYLKFLYTVIIPSYDRIVERTKLKINIVSQGGK